MSNVVFILGAGASKGCGAPLMAEFLDEARRLCLTGQVQEEKQDFDEVFQAIGRLQAVHSKSQLDLTNIESIFTALEVAKVIRKLPGTEADKIPQVINALKGLIVKTLEASVKFRCSQSSIGYPYGYESFAELVRYVHKEASPTHSVSIITFNYDIAADMALHLNGLGPDYGIEAEPDVRHQVPLLKLHGSLNWASAEAGEGIYPLHLRDYLKVYSVRRPDIQYCTVPIGSQLKEYFESRLRLQVLPEPIIVPPTWYKADHHQTLSEVWSKAAKHLEEAEYIFVIGYSLPRTDGFFRLLYGLGTVSDTPLQKFVVFDPEDKDAQDGVNARFRAMLGSGALARYDYRECTFDKAVPIIRGYFPGRQR